MTRESGVVLKRKLKGTGVWREGRLSGLGEKRLNLVLILNLKGVVAYQTVEHGI